MHTNKAWIKDVIAHRDTLNVPFNLPLSPVARKLLEAHYKTSDLEEFLGFPIRMNSPNSIKPLYADPAIFGGTAVDEFGVVWTTNPIDRGTPTGHCLSEDNLSGYKFPDAASDHRFELLEDWCGKNGNNFTVIWVGDLWERASFMRGMENLLLDLYINPSFVRSLLRKLTDYILKTMEILFERMDFDCIALSDDYGSQNAMIMSPDSWRSIVKPYVREIYDFAKRNNRYVQHHSCGHIFPIVGDLIDIGLDILHPVQPEAMDVYKLKREFGKHLTFCGGLNTQQLLPYGSPDEIRKEIRKLKQIMGEGGGYIVEPGITLQADVPLANIIATIDEMRQTDIQAI